MKQIMKAGGYAIYVSGGFTDRTKTYNIDVHSTMDNSKNPDHFNRLNQLNLTASELDTYIEELKRIRG